jgi:CubicO group peptidase (beta-lactamase class C family)
MRTGQLPFHRNVRRFNWSTQVAGAALLIMCLAAPVVAQERTGPSEAQIDELAARSLEAFRVPGMAIGIVRNGEVVHLKGYGRRDIGKPGAVDPHTIFKIASNSKAFTTAALAMLVDEGKIAWDSRVTGLLPEFRMHDPDVTREITIRDLLTHRSGLGLGAGDLMLWPSPNHFTRDDIVRALRYFSPVHNFRSKYTYDNTLYIVAGEIIAEVSGQSYETFIDRRIMKPLGLKSCFAGPIPPEAMKNAAKPHGVIDEKVIIIERSLITNEPSNMVAAGGLHCSAHDMLVWIQTQLNRGVSPGGVRLFSERQAAEMWQPQTEMRVSQAERARDRTTFKAYGLGWRISDVHGYMQVSHTGTVSGMLSAVTMIPELDLGIVVLVNGASSDARNAVMFSLVHGLVGAPPRDWITRFANARKANPWREPDPACKADPDAGVPGVTGTYEDPWFGRIEVASRDGVLRFRSAKSPRLAGTMTFCHRPNVYAVRWDDRTLAAGDALARVETGAGGKVTSMRMERIDPRADYSFDFQDLSLRKVK